MSTDPKEQTSADIPAGVAIPDEVDTRLGKIELVK